MFTIAYTNKFLKDAKLLKKRSSNDAILLKNIISILAQNGVTGLDKNTRHINWWEIIKGFGNAT